MATMKTMQLGDTGAEVSRLCFGAMRCGTLNDYDESCELLDMFTAAGGNFIDTANCYSKWYPGGTGGDSEEVLGRWMGRRGNRDEVFMATKVGFGYQDVETGLPAATIAQECERSLKRLNTDRIDLLYAHVDDFETPLEEVLGAFDALVKSGKVRFVAASNYSAWRLADAEAVSRAGGLVNFCCVQQRYSYFRPRPGATFGAQVSTNDDLLDFCAARGMPLLPYSPLLGGSYCRDDKPRPEQYVGPDSDARMIALESVAAETGATIHQVILAWMLHHVQPVLPVFSARDRAQMQENLAAVDVNLTPEQVAHLDQAGDQLGQE